MTFIVPRTYTDITDLDKPRTGTLVSRPLESFRSLAAYVLLGDPGAGKTTAFKNEEDAIDDAKYIPARDFITLDPNNHPEWHSKTLFIDGLDEVRAGSSDYRVPFDEIRRRLDNLGKPRFRLSCREADWLGRNDLKHLMVVLPDTKLSVLRLDPLKESDVICILKSHPQVENAEAFIEKAVQLGIDELLANPQTLDLLVAAVSGGNTWPRSRLETFESACQEIAREHNEEHRIADNMTDDPDLILDSAGRLSALLLISGSTGIARHLDQVNADFAALDRCEYYQPEFLKAALATKLFRTESTDRFMPVHRHIAEFLGARHLGRIIDGGLGPADRNGLPARRVISLLTGEDGMVVSELRGMSGWLAAHCAKARRDLIARDPVGVGLYGDITGFSIEDKNRILDSLGHRSAKLDSVIRKTSGFAGLATPEMLPILRDVMTDRNRSEETQLQVEFVLRILAQEFRSIDLAGILYGMIRDETRWPRVRRWALKTVIQHESNPDETERLLVLLADINNGRVSDPDFELRGTLLTRLYPENLPPSDVWQSLSDNGTKLLGYYRLFWYESIIEKSSNEQIAELLDSLGSRIGELLPALEFHNLNSLPIKLLARGLKAYGDKLEVGRLYDWLGVPWVGGHSSAWGSDDSYREVQSWLEHRPDVQKAIILECHIRRYNQDEESKHHSFVITERIYSSRFPDDSGAWCLKEAAALSDVNPLVAEYLFDTAVILYQSVNDDAGLSKETLKEYAGENERLNGILELRLSPLPEEIRYEEEGKKREREHEERENRWIQQLRDNRTEFLENRAEPVLLYELAHTYFDRFVGFRSTDGPRNIANRLGGDQDLINAVLDGLKGTIVRRDVPDAKSIFDLARTGRLHYLSLPFQAGMAEFERLKFEDGPQWTEGTIRTALATYYLTGFSSYLPGWYRWLLTQYPEKVSDVFIPFVVSEFHRSTGDIQLLHDLAMKSNYEQVALFASLRLLQAFPIRCNRSLLTSLDYLLWAAIKFSDRPLLRNLISSKLSRPSMNVAQQARWLAASLIVSPGEHDNALHEFVRGGRRREYRILNIATFLNTSGFFFSSFNDLGEAIHRLLIGAIGSAVGPEDRFGSLDERSKSARFVTPVMEASEFVHRMIEKLAADPTQEVTDSLKALVADEALSKWRDVISSKLDNQTSIRLAAEYSHPSVEEICHTLNGAQPANAADLAALVLDRLHELATRIRESNTDDWRQYWNHTKDQSPTPKHEEWCRDSMLSDLRFCLPGGVDAQPEGQYANDKRADIRVAFSDFQVPIEIKRNISRELWSALQNQLLKQYVRDPATDGYGIYLVFWFGKELTQPPPDWKRPETPAELLERLKAALSEEEARKISICVIDVSTG